MPGRCPPPVNKRERGKMDCLSSASFRTNATFTGDCVICSYLALY